MALTDWRDNYPATEDAIAEIAERTAKHDRTLFDDIFADALTNKPSADDWKALASKNPHRYVQSLQGIAKLRGFADKTEHVEVKRTIHETVTLLVAQVGPEQARATLESMGLPLSPFSELLKTALPEPTKGEIIEHTDTQSP